MSPLSPYIVYVNLINITHNAWHLEYFFTFFFLYFLSYQDLKPPTFPTPMPSTSNGATRASVVDAIPSAPKSTPSIQTNLADPSSSIPDMKTRPLSTYIV